MLYPRDPVPNFETEMLDGGRWRLSEQSPRNFVMIVVYRGYQCPLCKAHLTGLNEHIDTLESLGIETFVVSAESKEQVEKARSEWGLTKLSMGYGLDPTMGHKWGLYISERFKEGKGESEAELFFEPGLFLIRGDDQTLYYTSIQNMPFGRPDWNEFIRLMGHIVGTDYPARGHVKLFK
ncbi:MAG: redoxin domain-containing protein [Parasphingorhabdus sp.]|nr:redoxin domain-containing protein [Parasphingorhabdus sp.]